MRPTPTSPTDEVTLVLRAQDGDTASFEKLITAYQGRLTGLCVRMLNNRADAEDVVQETFVNAWRRLGTLKNPAAFKSWIFRMASNGCMDLLRGPQAKRSESVDPADMVEESALGPTPEENAELASAMDALNQVLQGLPDEQRIAWLLHEMDGQSYAEIAEVLGVSEGSVRGRLHRARISIVQGMKGWS